MRGVPVSRRKARGPAARRREVEQAARCPDCLSDVETRWQLGELYRLTVAHDPGCPWFGARGERPFAEFRVLASGAPR